MKFITCRFWLARVYFLLCFHSSAHLDARICLKLEDEATKIEYWKIKYLLLMHSYKDEIVELQIPYSKQELGKCKMSIA